MKRTFAIWALAAAVVAAAFPATAGAAMVGTLEVNVGYMKSSNEVTFDGESLGGGVGFGVAFWKSAGPMLSWGGEVSLDNLGGIEETYVDPFTLETINQEVSAKTLRINPGVRLNLGTMVGPSFFMQAGAGLYNVTADYRYSDTSGFSFEADESESEFGLNLGAGVGFPVGPKTRLSVQGQYHNVANDGENLDYLAFRAGLGFSL